MTKRLLGIFAFLALLGCAASPPAYATVTAATPRAEYLSSGGTVYQCVDTSTGAAFPIWAKTDLSVYVGNSLRTVDTDYTVTFTAGVAANCYVTMASAPATNTSVILIRQSPQARTTDFATSGAFSMASLNRQVDYLTTLTQDLKERVNRAPLYGPGVTKPSPGDMPAPSASKVIGYDASGKLANVSINGSTWSGLTDLADPALGSKIVAHSIVNRSVYDRLMDVVSIKDFGAKGDGVTDDTPALTNAMAITNGSILIPPGNYKITNSLTIPQNLVFTKNAAFYVSNGITLTITGAVQAGDYEIFNDGGGTVFFDNTPNPYNLAWFMSGTGYINERWDFARRGMVSFTKKVVIVPKPYTGQSGTFTSASRVFWAFNNEILITDKQNTSNWYLHGEFRAAGNCSNFMRFYDAAKPENINFYGGLDVLIPFGTTVGCGLRMTTASRITFAGHVVINGGQDNIIIGGSDQTAPSGDIFFGHVTSSFFYNTAFQIYGHGTHTVQQVFVTEISAQSAQVANKYAVDIEGHVRSVQIGAIIYNKNTGQDGWTAVDIDTVLRIAANAENTTDSIFCGYIKVGHISHAQTSNGSQVLQITSVVNSSLRVKDIQVDQIKGFFAGTAANLAYCAHVSIRDVYNNSDVILASTALYTMAYSGADLRTFTDNGGVNSTNLFNNYAVVNRGAGGVPAATLSYPLGSIIRNVADGKVFLRILSTGVANTDFAPLN